MNLILEVSAQLLDDCTCAVWSDGYAIQVPKRYINVMIPVELADEVDKILEKKLLGYRSRAEFVVEAVRDKLMQVKE